MRQVAKVGIAAILLGWSPPVSFAQGATAKTYTDPFAYCAMAGSIDEPGSRYRGPESPSVVERELGGVSAFRCLNGQVLGCSLGASGRACFKRDPSSRPTPEMFTSCRRYGSIPMAVQGGSAWNWECKRGVPHPVERYPLDARGFLRESWQVISPPRLKRSDALLASPSRISLPASFPLYNQHDAGNLRLYASSDWANAMDTVSNAPRKSLTCLATVYAMIEHARRNSLFRVGPDSWSDQSGAIAISRIGRSTTLGAADPLLAQFRNGNPVILWGPLPRNEFGHYVLAIGTNSLGKIIIHDPSGGKIVTVDPKTWRVSGGSVLSSVEKYRTVGF